ncbi:hypothetical protein BDN67DRAFT_572231 [Paxillus ammoniavirescens]|nr:hypothetical protein BDN67DRAFT_572231 [Paxillus ammoniavirescens]
MCLSLPWPSLLRIGRYHQQTSYWRGATLSKHSTHFLVMVGWIHEFTGGKVTSGFPAVIVTTFHQRNPCGGGGWLWWPVVNSAIPGKRFGRNDVTLADTDLRGHLDSHSRITVLSPSQDSCRDTSVAVARARTSLVSSESKPQGGDTGQCMENGTNLNKSRSQRRWLK